MTIVVNGRRERYSDWSAMMDALKREMQRRKAFRRTRDAVRWIETPAELLGI